MLAKASFVLLLWLQCVIGNTLRSFHDDNENNHEASDHDRRLVFIPSDQCVALNSNNCGCNCPLTGNINPPAACTPFRSLEYCPPETSFSTLISARKSVVDAALATGDDLGGFWFHHLDDKIAGYLFTSGFADSNIRPPLIYDVVENELHVENAFGFDNGKVVIRASNTHSNFGVFVFNGPLPSKELLRDQMYDIDMLKSELSTLNPEYIIYEELIHGYGGQVLPMEFKVHAFDGFIESISVIVNRGTPSCSCYTEIDVTGARLDQYGCFEPGGSEQLDADSCPVIDYAVGEQRARKFKGFNLCEAPPEIPDCLFDTILQQAKTISQAIGVYMRIDFFLGRGGEIYVQEYSTNHAGGLRHCSARKDDHCVNPCFLGESWQFFGDGGFGGNATFGGVLVDLDPDSPLTDYIAAPNRADQLALVSDVDLNYDYYTQCPRPPDGCSPDLYPCNTGDPTRAAMCLNGHLNSCATQDVSVSRLHEGFECGACV